eukprot:152147-Rhodomonas_salina.3
MAADLHSREDNVTTRFYTRANAGRQHIKTVLNSKAHNMPDGSGKTFLQASTGKFPVYQNLAKWGTAESPDCPFCPWMEETVLHWQCQCLQFDDPQTAAHNSIWNVTTAQILRAAQHHWTFLLESPIGRTNLLCSQAYENWLPDGLCYDPDSNAITLLEFTHRSYASHNSLLAAVERKEIKYDVLLDNLRLRNPSISFSLSTFAI